MRQNLLVLLASAVVVSATHCLQDNIADLTKRTTCGRSKAIAKCLHTEVNLASLEEVERCYVAGGCDTADATAEAVWFTHDCLAYQVQEAEQELRRRADSTTTTAVAATTTASSTQAVTVASTSATTTAASTTASSSVASTSGSSTVSSTLSSTSSTSSSSVTTTSSSTGTTNTCSSTSTISTTACYTISGSTTCTSTTQETATCAPGLLCFAATTTTTATCMVIDNSMDTGGLVVTICFAIGIAFTIICFVVSAMRAKSKAKKDASARLLTDASMGKGKDVEAANPFASEANLPLMEHDGARSDVVGGQEYGHQGAPRLGALGQETSEARY